MKRSIAISMCVRTEAAIDNVKPYCTTLQVISPITPDNQICCRYKYITVEGTAKNVIITSATAILATNRLVVVLSRGVLCMT